MKFLFLTLLLISCSTPKTQKTLPNPDSLKVGVVNYSIEGGKTLDEVVIHLENLARDAKGKGAAYILYPELVTLDLFPKNPSTEEVKLNLESLSKLYPKYENSLANIATKNQINIIGASTVVKKGEKYINRAFYISPNGEIKHQDKVKPTPWERDHHFVGAKNIEVFQDKTMSFAILICHDAEFPVLSESLVKKRPEVIFVPSQTDDEFGLNRVKVTSEARAIEHFSYVLMTGTSGIENAPWHSYWGRNFLFTPQNKYFPNKKLSSSLPHKEELSVFQLELGKIREGRKDLKQVNPSRDSAN